MQEFPHITTNPKIMMGKPCIRGKRLTVEMILGQLGAGVTIDRLLSDYPNLEREDILESMRYASWLATTHEVDLAEAS